MSPSSASGISPDGGGDPLSEALDLLDQFNNDGDHVDVDHVDDDDLGIVDGFDDFAIDSDDEEKFPSDPGAYVNGSVGASEERDASGNETARVSASRAPTSFVVSSETAIKNNATTTTTTTTTTSVALEPPPAHWANEDDALDMGSATEERARASAGSPLKTRHDAFVHPLQDLGMPAAPAPSVGNAYHPAATSNGPNSTATATATLAVPSSSAAATTSTTWSSLSSNFASFASRAAASVQNAVENAEAAVLHGGAVSGPSPPTAASASHGQHAGGPGHVPRQPPVVSYQERQKMLHRKYHHHGASSLGGGAPTPSPPVDSSATNSNIHPSAPSSSSSVSPPSTATPPTPSSSTTPPTFLEKLTTALDAATKTKLVSSALGPLLPGERVIMFLNSLNDVKDSRFPHLMVGSDDVLGGNLRRCLSFGSGRTEEGDGDAAVTVWCCVMTFYRVAVMSYRCSLEGQVLFDDDDDDGGEYGTEAATATVGAESKREFESDDNHLDVGNSYDDNLRSEKESMIRQWVRSKSVSIQFQQAHCSPPSHSHPHKRYPRQRVFEMPLASIERVEKIMSSAQRQLVGATPSSSSNSIMYGNYPGILPSSSTVSSASSAMSSLGSQMKPLLGGMGMGIAPSGNGGGGGGGGNTNASNPYTGAATSTLNGGGIGHNGINAAGGGGSHVHSSNHPYAYAPASTSTGPLGIVLHGKDGGRWIKFSTNSYTDAMRAHEALQTYAFPGRRNLGYLFAFESRRAEVMAGSVGGGSGSGGLGHNGGGEGRGQGQGRQSASAKGGKGEGGTVVAAATPPTRRRFVPMEEFERQGIFSSRGDGNDATSRGHVMSSTSPWAPILGANANYGLCATYPSVLVGPCGIVGGGSGTDGGDSYSNETNGLPDNGIGLLRRCAAFRSENRLPALTWGSPHHGGSIWRCSQPKVGLQGNRSIEDERYLYAIAEEAKRANLKADARLAGGVGGGSNGEDRPPTEFLRMLCGRNNESDLIMDGSNPCSLKIMDMRPKSAAMANRTQGYGYENTNYYRGASINFYGIGNIHAVRDSYQKVCALCLSPNTSDIQWMQLVENTNWPSMTRLILSASWQTAFHVHYNRLPVLLHCSHGWDRTSQVAALSQLLLDPHYRTREGFSTLVEKDFLSFGHPFHTRCGHGEGKNEQGGDEGQLSPIFIQFLDCVFQLVNQFPDYFEFNARYLLLLSEHIYSCRFGTLLCDSEREREVVAGIRQRTYCMWEYLDSIPDLINPMFDRATSEKAGVLLMPLPMLLRNVTLWVDRFCMYGAKASIPCMPHGLQYPPQYFLGNHSIVHTVGYGAESALRRALEDAEMWRGTALNALKEVEDLRKKVSDKEKESKEDPAADLLSS